MNNSAKAKSVKVGHGRGLRSRSRFPAGWRTGEQPTEGVKAGGKEAQNNHTTDSASAGEQGERIGAPVSSGFKHAERNAVEASGKRLRIGCGGEAQ